MDSDKPLHPGFGKLTQDSTTLPIRQAQPKHPIPCGISQPILGGVPYNPNAFFSEYGGHPVSDILPAGILYFFTIPIS